MFQFMLTPLDDHFDDGLGATGEAFLQAAKALDGTAAATSVANGHLAISFLNRHASELFLKSMIVVIHRALALPYGVHGSDGQAFIRRTDAWIPLHRVHSLGSLWEYVIELLSDNAQTLADRCQTDWLAIPPALPAGIAVIDAADASSTFFHYPDKRTPGADRAKSSWKATTPEAALEAMHSASQPRKWFVLTGPGDQISRMYEHDPNPLPQLASALREVADLLSGAHLGLRVELANGR